jgi:mono/diheme cytochrome c family protein
MRGGALPNGRRGLRTRKSASTIFIAITAIIAAASLAGIAFVAPRFAAPAWAQEPPDPFQPANEDKPTTGKADFMKHCAPCHGDNGKGHGPEVNLIPGIHPSDLTNIAMKNGGVFPRQEVEDMVDGRKAVPSHQRFDMPFWGVNFQQSGKEFTPESEARAKARIAALADYVESIQRH